MLSQFLIQYIVLQLQWSVINLKYIYYDFLNTHFESNNCSLLLAPNFRKNSEIYFKYHKKKYLHFEDELK